MFELKTAALIALACLGLASIAEAVSPPPDGGYLQQNTAEGEDALFSLTDGFANTAIGFEALYSNTSGGSNTATGSQALYFNINGFLNTATGFQALYSNTTGSSNTATGFGTLFRNTTGSLNTATGVNALLSNTTGIFNTATGANAMYFNTTGDYNEATGNWTLFYNSTGNNNTAAGNQALFTNTSGNNNTAAGSNALENNTSGSSNIALGGGAGRNLTTGNNNIDIGHAGVAAESSTIRIGTAGNQTRAFMAGIYGTTVTGTPVKINSSGQLGVTPSSARFKHKVKPMDAVSDAVLALNPVTFCYKSDETGTPQFGLIAEDVEKVAPDLVVRDSDGKPYTVRYDAVNAMLLNEFLKEHRKVEEQGKTINELRSAIAQQAKGMEALTAQVEEQAAQIQRVSADLAASKTSAQLVDNR